MADLVRTETRAGVATLTLDSPHNRNALSSALLAQLSDALDRAMADPSVRTVVLTGSGSVFCSGADLKERASVAAGGAAEQRFSLPEVLSRLTDGPKPVVGRINGAARGGGLGLVAACDIAVARRSATFAFSEVRIGVVPAMIAVTVLPRLSARAGLELFLTGETFDADRAAAVGLVNAATDDLDTEVDRYVRMLVKGGPNALATVKSLVRRVPDLPVEQAYQEMERLSLATFASAEAAEGIAAFLGKRAAGWEPG